MSFTKPQLLDLWCPLPALFILKTGSRDGDSKVTHCGFIHLGIFMSFLHGSFWRMVLGAAKKGLAEWNQPVV